MTEKTELTVQEAVFIAEGIEEVETPQEYYAAWQKLVDSGTAWELQGWFSRTAQSLIEAGHIQAGSVI